MRRVHKRSFRVFIAFTCIGTLAFGEAASAQAPSRWKWTTRSQEEEAVNRAAIADICQKNPQYRSDAPTVDQPCCLTDDQPGCQNKEKIPVLAIIAAVIVIGIFIWWISKNSKFGNLDASRLPTEAELIEEGPQLPDQYPVGSLTVQAFARNGWPIVVDYQPKSGTQTVLDVRFRDGGYSLVVDDDGSSGRQLREVALPEDGPAPEPTPATYVLRSVRLDTVSDDPTRRQKLVPLEVYGIGGGPRAVGSVAIEQLRFTPGQVRVGMLARYDYATKSPFNRTRAEVLRFKLGGDKIKVTRVLRADAVNVGIGPHGGVWDGRNQQQNLPASIGKHQFQVRGWFTSDDRSWVAAIAPELVRVQP